MNSNCLIEKARQKINNFNKKHSSTGCCSFTKTTTSTVGPTGPEETTGSSEQEPVVTDGATNQTT